MVRAFVEHHPLTPWKAWYVTPAFRHEQPQAGRFQPAPPAGVEAIGTEDPDLDVEVVSLAASLYRKLGLERVNLAVNSMGCGECRQKYVTALRRVPGGAPGAAVRRAQGPARPAAAGPRLQEAGVPRRHRECAPPGPTSWTPPCAEHFARFNEGLNAVGDRAPPGAPAREGIRLLHPDHLRVRVRGIGDGAERGRRWRGATTGSWSRSAGRRHPGSGSVSGSSGYSWPATRRVVSRSIPPALDAFVVDLTGGEQARDCVRSCTGAGLGADRAFEPVTRVPAQTRGPLGGACSP